MIALTQQPLAAIHPERDSRVARWLKDHANLDLREALTTAFSAGVTSALNHTDTPTHPVPLPTTAPTFQQHVSTLSSETPTDPATQSRGKPLTRRSTTVGFRDPKVGCSSPPLTGHRHRTTQTCILAPTTIMFEVLRIGGGGRPAYGLCAAFHGSSTILPNECRLSSSAKASATSSRA